VVGRVVGTHGLRGGLRVSLMSDFPTAFRRRKRLLLGDELRPVDVVSARGHGEMAILELRGVDTIEAAAALRGQLLHVPADEVAKPPRGEHFWHEIVGLRVEGEDGRDFGPIREILRTGANDVYVVDGASGELLIPAIADVVRKIAAPCEPKSDSGTRSPALHLRHCGNVFIDASSKARAVYQGVRSRRMVRSIGRAVIGV
jgi:16S rRNA processing protein RimM